MAVQPRTQQLHQLLADAKAAFVREAHERIHAAGFPGIGANGIVFRWLHADGSRLAELVEASGMTKQAFGEHVSSLEAAGYLVRTPDPLDGRAKLIVPTPLGRAAMAKATEIFGELEAEWAAAVGPEELTTVRAVLERMAY